MTRPKMDMRLSKKSYKPGDVVEVMVTVTADKPTEIQEGCIDLVGDEMTPSVLARGITTGALGAVPDEVPVTLYRASNCFLAKSVIPGGVPQTYKVTLNIPSTAVSSAKNDKVRWLVEGLLNLRHARDVHKRIEVVVR